MVFHEVIVGVEQAEGRTAAAGPDRNLVVRHAVAGGGVDLRIRTRQILGIVRQEVTVVVAVRTVAALGVIRVETVVALPPGGHAVVVGVVLGAVGDIGIKPLVALRTGTVRILFEPVQAVAVGAGLVILEVGIGDLGIAGGRTGPALGVKLGEDVAEERQIAGGKRAVGRILGVRERVEGNRGHIPVGIGVARRADRGIGHGRGDLTAGGEGRPVDRVGRLEIRDGQRSRRTGGGEAKRRGAALLHDRQHEIFLSQRVGIAALHVHQRKLGHAVAGHRGELVVVLADLVEVALQAGGQRTVGRGEDLGHRGRQRTLDGLAGGGTGNHRLQRLAAGQVGACRIGTADGLLAGILLPRGIGGSLIAGTGREIVEGEVGEQLGHGDSLIEAVSGVALKEGLQAVLQHIGRGHLRRAGRDNLRLGAGAVPNADLIDITLVKVVIERPDGRVGGSQRRIGGPGRLRGTADEQRSPAVGVGRHDILRRGVQGDDARGRLKRRLLTADRRAVDIERQRGAVKGHRQMRPGIDRGLPLVIRLLHDGRAGPGLDRRRVERRSRGYRFTGIADSRRGTGKAGKGQEPAGAGLKAELEVVTDIRHGAGLGFVEAPRTVEHDHRAGGVGIGLDPALDGEGPQAVRPEARVALRLHDAGAVKVRGILAVGGALRLRVAGRGRGMRDLDNVGRAVTVGIVAFVHLVRQRRVGRADGRILKRPHGVDRHKGIGLGRITADGHGLGLAAALGDALRLGRIGIQRRIEAGREGIGIGGLGEPERGGVGTVAGIGIEPADGLLIVGQAVAVGIGIGHTGHPRVGKVIVGRDGSGAERRITEGIVAHGAHIGQRGTRIHSGGDGAVGGVDPVFVVIRAGRKRTVVLAVILAGRTQDRVQTVEDFPVIVHTVQIGVGGGRAGCGEGVLIADDIRTAAAVHGHRETAADQNRRRNVRPGAAVRTRLHRQAEERRIGRGRRQFAAAGPRIFGSRVLHRRKGQNRTVIAERGSHHDILARAAVVAADHPEVGNDRAGKDAPVKIAPVGIVGAGRLGPETAVEAADGLTVSREDKRRLGGSDGLLVSLQNTGGGQNGRIALIQVLRRKAGGRAGGNFNGDTTVGVQIVDEVDVCRIRQAMVMERADNLGPAGLPDLVEALTLCSGPVLDPALEGRIIDLAVVRTALLIHHPAEGGEIVGDLPDVVERGPHIVHGAAREGAVQGAVEVFGIVADGLDVQGHGLVDGGRRDGGADAHIFGDVPSVHLDRPGGGGHHKAAQAAETGILVGLCHNCRIEMRQLHDRLGCSVVPFELRRIAIVSDVLVVGRKRVGKRGELIIDVRLGRRVCNRGGIK